jgi:predicted lysophospholipase L1 biosynthesis ABC-type transport system permease subunit
MFSRLLFSAIKRRKLRIAPAVLAVVMGIAGGILGYFVGLFLAQFIGMEIFDMNVSIKPEVFILTLLISTMVACAASLLPIRRAISIDPVVILNNSIFFFRDYILSACIRTISIGTFIYIEYTK